MTIRGHSGPARRRSARGVFAAVLIVGAVLVGSLGLATSAQAGWADFPQKIINYSSNKCLQPQSFAPNARVEQRTCSGFATLQAWQPVNADADGYVWLRNTSTGMCMDLWANSREEVGNGTLIQVFTCAEESWGQRWNRVNGSRDGHFMIFAKERPTLCLDVQNRSSSNGALLQLYQCKFFEDAQQFRLVDW